MKKQTNRTLHWVRLDNAAKIYPAARRRNWSNIFRQSITLNEEVDTELLKSALDSIVLRFPTICARLRKGIFWYYLQQVSHAPEIMKEHSYPLTYMSNSEMRKCAFRVIVYRERIAVEFFHSLTDGTGGMIFLKSLVAEYLRRKHKIQIAEEHGVLSPTGAPKPEELEDCFVKYAAPFGITRDSRGAFRVKGEPLIGDARKLTCFKISADRLILAAHEYKATVTVFLTAVMMKAFLNLQSEKVHTLRRCKPVRVLVPVNLRKLFPSNTLRNFAMYTVPEADPRLGEYGIEELCTIIKSKMELEVNQKYMSSLISTNVKDELNPLLRIVPLPVKNLVMKAIFDHVGERTSTLSLSNLGAVDFPEEMKPYIRRVDFILGVQATAPYNCGVISYGNTVNINIIRNIRGAELERHFWSVLQKLGIEATVESN